MAVLVEDAEEAVGGDETAVEGVSAHRFGGVVVMGGKGRRAYPMEWATRMTPTFRSFGGQGLSRCALRKFITCSFSLPCASECGTGWIYTCNIPLARENKTYHSRKAAVLWASSPRVSYFG